MQCDPSSIASSAPRLGKPCTLPIAQSSFSTLISCRARYKWHPGLLEAHALRLALEWVGQSPACYSKRLVVLIEPSRLWVLSARAALSAGALKRQVSKISSLCLALDIGLHLGYVPSEQDPADHPSRGHALPARHPRRPKTRVFTKRRAQQQDYFAVCDCAGDHLWWRLRFWIHAKAIPTYMYTSLLF